MSRRDTPPLVRKAVLAPILDKIREDEPLHRWEAEAVTKHFAYLLPEGQRFSLADVEGVMLALGIGEIHVEQILHGLTYDEKVVELEMLIEKTLLSRMRLRPHRLIERYYMVKKSRVEYEALVAEFGCGAEPEQHGISQRLANLRGELSDPQQQVFLDETLKCLRIDANRAAIVMGWNLAYDHLRQWVFRHHLKPSTPSLRHVRRRGIGTMILLRTTTTFRSRNG